MKKRQKKKLMKGKGKVEVKKDQPTDIRSGVKPQQEMGRLVMTVDGQQKQLPFSPRDLLSSATMLDGDKVRLSFYCNEANLASMSSLWRHGGWSTQIQSAAEG